MEEWKQIEGFNYIVSNLGHIINTKLDKEVRPYLDKGKLKVTFYNGTSRNRKAQNLATIIYNNFIKPLNGKTYIGFKDGNIYNCAANNLFIKKREIKKEKKPQIRKTYESNMDQVTFALTPKIPYADNVTVRPKYSGTNFSQVIWR